MFDIYQYDQFTICQLKVELSRYSNAGSPLTWVWGSLIVSSTAIYRIISPFSFPFWHGKSNMHIKFSHLFVLVMKESVLLYICIGFCRLLHFSFISLDYSIIIQLFSYLWSIITLCKIWSINKKPTYFALPPAWCSSFVMSSSHYALLQKWNIEQYIRWYTRSWAH